MFGYVCGDLHSLDEAQKARYHAVYCGVCRAIGRRSGQTARLTLSYDLAFLVLLLSSLYEPEEEAGSGRCIVHPAKRSAYVTNRFTDYAADMNVYLANYKAIDDWKDDKRPAARLLAAGLSKPCKAIERAWPRATESVKSSLAALASVEKDAASTPDEAVNAFGRLMGALFVYDELDPWAGTLRVFGEGLGRFVYLMDAALDYEKDRKSGAYNPLFLMDKQPGEMRGALTLLVGEAAKAFETLPLEQDLPLLRNILYGGVWQAYNTAQEKAAERKCTHD